MNRDADIGKQRQHSTSATTARPRVGDNDTLNVGKELTITAGDEITIDDRQGDAS